MKRLRPYNPSKWPIPLGKGYLALLLVIGGMAAATHGQPSRQELEQSKQAIEQEIRLINQLLQETRRTAEVSMNQLVMLNTQINRRENLLRTIGNEISGINRRIGQLQGRIHELNEELELLRAAYADMIRHAHRSRDRTQRLMFLLSSQSINQAMLRTRHLQRLAQHRQTHAGKIEATRTELQQTIAALEEERSQQQQLLTRQRRELRQLGDEKTAQDRNINALRREEQALTQRLREQQQAAQRLQNEIRRIIAEEQRAARARAEAEGRVTTDMFALTPEELLLSNSFAENRGKLLWPVERGVITGRFGQQPHPVLPGIMISNNGIDIATSQGAHARAIFDGTVSRVISVPGAHYAVIVRHGEYLSVYSNLSEVFVSNGQRVSIRQELGVAATDSRDAKTYVHLEIWKGSDKLNPSLWLARQR